MRKEQKIAFLNYLNIFFLFQQNRKINFLNNVMKQNQTNYKTSFTNFKIKKVVGTREEAGDT